jgi:hypothetical protein
MLRYSECAPLDGSIVRCGRHPHLFPCSPEALRRVSTCSNWQRSFGEDITAVVNPRGQDHRCRIDWNHTDPAVAAASLEQACYLSGEGVYFCPSSAAADAGGRRAPRRGERGASRRVEGGAPWRGREGGAQRRGEGGAPRRGEGVDIGAG